jgi:hypothetical protein
MTTDIQLIKMMIGQCIYLSLMSTPILVDWIYSEVRVNIVPDALQTAKEQFFSNAAGVLSTTGACASFYIFTLSSQLFHRELIHLFKRRSQGNRQTQMNQTINTDANKLIDRFSLKNKHK